jgi:hypothetical protein
MTLRDSPKATPPGTTTARGLSGAGIRDTTFIHFLIISTFWSFLFPE